MTESEQQKEPLFVGLSAGVSGYRACAADICGKRISVLKNYAVPADETDWDRFVKTIELDFPDRTLVTAMDFDDGCVGFYHFDVPAVNEKQMPPLIASQAEIHFPLPIEQMRYHWKVLGQVDGKVDVAVAAARETMLAETVVQARQAQVDSIVLRCEAVVRGVRCLCDDLADTFSLLYLCGDEPKLLFVQNGMLAKVTALDCDCQSLADEQSPRALLLGLDIQNAMAEYPVDKESSLLLLADETASYSKTLQAVLQDKGIETRPIQLDLGRVSGDVSTETDLVTLGTALLASDSTGGYDLFRELYVKVGSEVKERRVAKGTLLAVAVCLLLVTLIAVSYGADKFRLATYEKQMDTSEFIQLQETHQLRNTIAQQRVDVPALIAKINESLPEGVNVQSMSVRRSQRISIGASCKEPKMMYGFVEALGKCRGVESVRISGQGFDEKKKQTTFTLTFDYKNFTRKGRVSR